MGAARMTKTPGISSQVLQADSGIADGSVSARSEHRESHVNRAQARVLLELPPDHPVGTPVETWGEVYDRHRQRHEAGLMTSAEHGVLHEDLMEALDLIDGRRSEPGEEESDLAWAKQVLGVPWPPRNLDDLDVSVTARLAELQVGLIDGDAAGQVRYLKQTDEVFLASRFFAGLQLLPLRQELRGYSEARLAAEREQTYVGLGVDPARQRLIRLPGSINHPLHIVLSVLTGGLWLIPYAVLLHRDRA